MRNSGPERGRTSVNQTRAESGHSIRFSDASHYICFIVISIVSWAPALCYNAVRIMCWLTLGGWRVNRGVREMALGMEERRISPDYRGKDRFISLESYLEMTE